MIDVSADIIYEISTYLERKDFMSIRFVWHDIYQDYIESNAAYLESLVVRKCKDSILKQYLHIPSVKLLFAKKDILMNIPHIFCGNKVLYPFTLFRGNTFQVFDISVSHRIESYTICSFKIDEVLCMYIKKDAKINFLAIEYIIYAKEGIILTLTIPSEIGINYIERISFDIKFQTQKKLTVDD
jgi:hypothetical protein